MEDCNQIKAQAVKQTWLHRLTAKAKTSLGIYCYVENFQGSSCAISHCHFCCMHCLLTVYVHSEDCQSEDAISTIVYVNHNGVGWKLVTIVWAEIGVLSIWLS